MTDLVSIIVPVYNVQKYLQRCVESLINQSYTNIEIILIDDGSSDDSLELCYKLAENDERIKVYKNDENIGQAATRQTGINLSAGKWIMFLDSDDAFDDNAVEKMVNFAKTFGADMVLSSYTVIQNEQAAVKKANIDEGIYSRKDFISLCLSKIEWNIMSCIGSKIYNREFLRKYEIQFESKYKYNEDGAFLIAALSNVSVVGYVDEPFYQYFIRNSGSTQTSYRENMFSYINKTDVILKRVFEENGLFNNEKKKLWYNKHIMLYLAVLANEARYKNYSSYKQVVSQIKKDEEYANTINYSTTFGIMLKIMIFSLKINVPILFYLVIKMHGLVKRHKRQYE